MTFSCRHISIAIQKPVHEVYAFAANPENLPKWAEGLSGSIRKADDVWIAESPMGKVRIKFAERNALGVLDHDVTLPSGQTFHNPMRVLPNDKGSEVVFTLYRQAEVTDQAFEKDAGQITKDLARLKALLE